MIARIAKSQDNTSVGRQGKVELIGILFLAWAGPYRLLGSQVWLQTCFRGGADLHRWCMSELFMLEDMHSPPGGLEHWGVVQFQGT